MSSNNQYVEDLKGLAELYEHRARVAEQLPTLIVYATAAKVSLKGIPDPGTAGPAMHS